MRIWAISRVVRLENWTVVIMVIIIWVGIRGVVCQRMLFVWSWLVWGLIVGVVVLLGVHTVVLSVVVIWVEGVALLIFLVMTI